MGHPSICDWDGNSRFLRCAAEWKCANGQRQPQIPVPGMTNKKAKANTEVLRCAQNDRSMESQALRMTAFAVLQSAEAGEQAGAFASEDGFGWALFSDAAFGKLEDFGVQLKCFADVVRDGEYGYLPAL